MKVLCDMNIGVAAFLQSPLHRLPPSFISRSSLL
jgi:hypothetical protein